VLTRGNAAKLYCLNRLDELARGTDSLAILDLGTTVLVGASLTDAADLALGSGASLVLGGGDVTLSGQASLGGTLVGPGTVSVTGTADVSGLSLTGTAELDDGGLIIQSGALSIGSSVTDSAMLTIESGATYDLISDDPIAGTGAATIANGGLFAKIGISGLSDISAAFSNTGSIVCRPGTPPAAAHTSSACRVLSAATHGEWSEAMESTSPASTRAHIASTVARERNGRITAKLIYDVPLSAAPELIGTLRGAVLRLDAVSRQVVQLPEERPSRRAGGVWLVGQTP